MAANKESTDLSDEAAVPTAGSIRIGDTEIFLGDETSREINKENVSIDDLRNLQDIRTYILDKDPTMNLTENGVSTYDTLNEINDRIEKAEIMLELRRVKNVLQQEEEINPPVIDECPICLERNIILDNGYSYCTFMCCGKFLCIQCRDIDKLEHCPLCRSDFPANEEEEFALKLKLATGGNGWAMTNIGGMCEYGRCGQQVDMRKAIQWYKRAADETDYAPAMTCLAQIYQEGVRGVVTKSHAKALSLFRKAAAKHNNMAWLELGRAYSLGKGNLQVDVEKAIKYFTLAIANDLWMESERDLPIEALLFFGLIFKKGYGSLNQSWNVSKFYFNEAKAAAAAERDWEREKVAEEGLGEAIYESWYESCGGGIRITTMSTNNDIPQALYWLRKSLVGAPTDEQNGDTLDLINHIISHVNFYCSACGKNKLTARETTLRNCARCKAVWYCSKECQVRHWKGGHKSDCWKMP